MKDLLKKLLPGFLPILIFILADEIFGTTIGIIVAIIFGILQFSYIFLKEKRIDKFIITDTLLLTVFGLISILLHDDIFFKLKPAIIETIFLIILGISAFSSKNLVLGLSKRYLKDIDFRPEQEKMLRQTIRTLFWIFLAHTLLIVYSALYMTTEAWGFISGALFYIIFFIYLAIELVYRRFFLHRTIEWLPAVDNDGKIIAKISRQRAHDGSKILHPVVHLHVINNKGEIFLQKRPLSKKIQPGKWDTAVGGHISFGETVEKALFRETNEEIGLKKFTPQAILKYIFESDIEKELVYTFATVINKSLKINKKELADGRFWKISEIDKNIGKNIFTPNFEQEYKILREFFVKKQEQLYRKL